MQFPKNSISNDEAQILLSINKNLLSYGGNQILVFIQNKNFFKFSSAVMGELSRITVVRNGYELVCYQRRIVSQGFKNTIKNKIDGNSLFLGNINNNCFFSERSSAESPSLIRCTNLALSTREKQITLE
mmetsp:Transcript_19878/g.22901  ORF Transcript_19878/g.22901 Transcript_19878/m.22901 type:complete len:129 (+) Transcript_19878:35-421(+)